MENIAVIGDTIRIKEFQEKVGDRLPAITYLLEGSGKDLELFSFELVLDLCLDEHPERLQEYAPHNHLLVIGAAVKSSLAEMVQLIHGPLTCRLFGINALPSFLNRATWEMSAFRPDDANSLDAFFQQIGVAPEWVQDRIGMVVPRVLLMIINEAFYTVQEGTASSADIDQAMKLGTNYPGGPFEWAKNIGYQHVIEVLEKLRQETGEGRYKVAPLLKQEWRHGLTRIDTD